MRQLLAYIKKEFYHVFRDSKTLILLFGMPIVQILLFGFALTNEIKNSELIICDYSNNKTSEKLIEKFRANNNFLLKEVIYDDHDYNQIFRESKVKLIITLPENFEGDLIHQGKSTVLLTADASDPNTSNTLVVYATNILYDFQKEMSNNVILIPYTIDTSIRMMYNPELKGAYNFVPGVMSLVLLLVCVLMTSVSIVREKELGTMEILLVSPTNPLIIIISKAIPYFLLSIVNLTVILLLSTYLLDMPINGSLFLLYLASSILILTALALGLLISNVTNSQEAAMLISLMGMLMPTILFTGFMFPIENMPLPLQIVSNIVPSRWYFIIVKDVVIKGLGFASIWKEMLVLMGMAIFL
ncbi:MAG TPA: ABC transporter permease, partial [Saprospiraceae bacterium]|nr:ABC transporter permease [Saprospiraceae bacterium]